MSERRRNQTITATVEAAAVGLSGGGEGSDALVGAGAFGFNEVAVAVSATIDGGNADNINAAGVTVAAADTATISAEVLAGSVGAAIGGETGTSIAIGVSFARNSISDPVTAYISDVPTLTSVGGDVSVTAQEGGSIESESAAVAFSVGIGGESGLAVGGGGALAANFIEAETQAYIYGSTVNTSGAPAGNVIVTATDNSAITAETLAIAASLGIGGESGTAVAIGVSLAYNEIGDASGFGSGQITADISNSAISANGQVEVTATSSGSIEALTASVAGALSGGGEFRHRRRRRRRWRLQLNRCRHLGLYQPDHRFRCQSGSR